MLDQLRWETPHPQLERLSARVVSALMTGLGIAIEPYAPTRTLPREIAYKPLDLTPLANRGFLDEKGEDGQGGWSDQGPDCDLRTFPTGRKEFGGVPFLVGLEPRCCIVLKSDARPFPERLPADVSIPLGFRVEGLCFLHAATYAGNGQEVGLYRIEYADGTVHDIRLVADENIRDWISPPALLPREKGTQSRIAWTGSTKLFPTASVFQMLWVNPRPEAAVKSVRFANPKRGACPILIALTAVVPDERAATDRKAALARAQQLLDRGLAAFHDGKDVEARGLLQQVLIEDPAQRRLRRPGIRLREIERRRRCLGHLPRLDQGRGKHAAALQSPRRASGKTEGLPRRPGRLHPFLAGRVEPTADHRSPQAIGEDPCQQIVPVIGPGGRLTSRHGWHAFTRPSQSRSSRAIATGRG